MRCKKKSYTRLMCSTLLYMCLLPVSVNNTVFAKSIPLPAIYSIDNLNRLKQEGANNYLISDFLKKADDLINEISLTVVGKGHSFSSNPHDYCSIAPYSWPNDKDPYGPYINKDGITNPSINLYDRPKLEEFANRLKVLSVAYYITNDNKYYDAFVKNIGVWFFDEETYMSPNFQYAQVVKGLNENKGQSYGLVELEWFTPVLESIYLLNSVCKIDKRCIQDLRSWFNSFLEWILNSEQWKIISKTNNNVVSGDYVALVEMARLTGNKRLIKKIKNDYTSCILNVQIDDEGKQPSELTRSDAFGYSVANLRHIVDFTLIMEYSGVRYYKKNHIKIDSAFDFLMQYVGHHDIFAYTQVGPWEYYERQLLYNKNRLQRLRTHKTSLLNYRESDISSYGVIGFVY